MTTRKLFGTDGVRGVAGEFLTHELALALGRAAAIELGAGVYVVGRDPRASGQMLEDALTAGILAEGGEVLSAGVIPTPGVAFLVGEMGASAGAVISASHNPARDNGIKFFGPDGYKLPFASEERIEELVSNLKGPPGPNTGRPRDRSEVAEAGSRYVEHALSALEGRSLAGLKVVLDCAHGAASFTSPEAFRRAGADVTVINAEPDGNNINDACGSTYPETLQKEVVRLGAALGLAHDGDADRVIAVDEQGNLVDGDAMIVMLALELKEQGRLAGDLVVATVMANLGFRKALAAHGLKLVETPVGDKYVLEEMRARGARIGGEQSGHIVLSDYSTTGDGLITGLRLAALVAGSGMPLSELAKVVERFPQVLVNVRVGQPERFEQSEAIRTEVEAAAALLGEKGRVLVRASGTEPLVRVMVEAEGHDLAAGTAQRLVQVIGRELGEEKVSN